MHADTGQGLVHAQARCPDRHVSQEGHHDWRCRMVQDGQGAMVARADCGESRRLLLVPCAMDACSLAVASVTLPGIGLSATTI